MTNLLNGQLARLAANSKNTFTIYKCNKDGKILTNSVVVNTCILHNVPAGSILEETVMVENYYGEDMGDDLVNRCQRLTRSNLGKNLNN